MCFVPSGSSLGQDLNQDILWFEEGHMLRMADIKFHLRALKTRQDHKTRLFAHCVVLRHRILLHLPPERSATVDPGLRETTRTFYYCIDIDS